MIATAATAAIYSTTHTITGAAPATTKTTTTATSPHLADEHLCAVEPVDHLQIPKSWLQINDKAIGSLAKDSRLQKLRHGIDVDIVVRLGVSAAAVSLAAAATLAAAAAAAAAAGAAAAGGAAAGAEAGAAAGRDARRFLKRLRGATMWLL
jgi:hypothetical protein